MPTNLIADLKKQAGGQLIDRGRVVDHLLDLRLAAPDDAGFTKLVDQILAERPGQTVVETDWWLDALERLANTAEPQPA